MNAKIIIAFAAAVSLAAVPALAQRVGSTGGGGVLDRPGQRTMNNYNPNDDRDPFSRGIRAFDAGDYVLAQQMFDEVLSQSPNDATVLVLYGMTYAGRGDYRNARRQYDRALRVDRDNLDAHRELGMALAKLGDAKGADGELKKLESMKGSCSGTCDAAKLDRAITAVQAAIATGAAPKKG